MTPILFFDKIQQQWEKKLPFVVYRKPESNDVKAMLQDNDTVYVTRDYSESGFVFAPFDSEKDVILIPEQNAFQMSTSIASTIDKLQELDYQEMQSEREDKSQHIKLVNRCLEGLEAEDLKKVVLSRTASVALPKIDPLGVFQKLLAYYPTAMTYCWYHPKVGLWLGATPETLLRIEVDTFYTMALAGTQVYKGSMEVDWGAKELEEQHMVSEDIHIGLIPLVSALEKSETYTHRAGKLLHLRTDITGVLNNTPLRTLINTLHPTAAVCGLPKQKAKAFILQNENYNREFYTGFFGEINMVQSEMLYGSKLVSTTLFVNLRCMQIKDSKALLYVGGGITKASIPEEEWEETVRKTNTVRVVL